MIGISPNTEKRVENRAQRSVFDEIRGAWIADETLSRVFYTSSQKKQKLRSKPSKSMLIKTGNPNLQHGCTFLSF